MMREDLYEALRDAMMCGYEYDEIMEMLDEVQEEVDAEDYAAEVEDTREEAAKALAAYLEALNGEQLGFDNFETFTRNLEEKLFEAENELEDIGYRIIASILECEDEASCGECKGCSEKKENTETFTKDKFLNILKQVADEDA